MSMQPQSNLRSLLSAVTRQLGAVRVARARYAVMLSPEFNCFDYISPDEMRLSEILAGLLNPAGKHAQGRIFLSCFLHRIGLDDWDAGGTQHVGTEVTTFNDRRFDIEIGWSDRKLVIENKPWASDQENQLQDYIADLRGSNLTSWHLVYLSGTGQEPSSVSIPDSALLEFKRSKNITLSSYAALIIPWIDDCKSVCQSERFRWFLEELRLYCMAEFEGEHDMQERQAVKKEILDSSHTLEAALEIFSAVPDIKQELLTLFIGQMKTHSDKAGLSCEWYGEYWKKYSEFNLTVSADQEYRLTFQFQKAPLNGLIFGMSKKDEGLPDKPEIAELMRKAGLGLGSGKTSSWWPWFAPVRAGIRDWEKDALPWMKMQDGTLAVEFIEMARSCYAIFRKENQMSLLK